MEFLPRRGGSAGCIVRKWEAERGGEVTTKPMGKGEKEE
jgi:hypothetical protein